MASSRIWIAVLMCAACGSDEHTVIDAAPIDAAADAAPIDAPPDARACTATETTCGTTCVDLMTAATDCGACGHACGACGGTTCTAGMCDPDELSSGQGAPYYLALDGDTVWWGADVDRTLSIVPAAGGATTVRYTGRTQIRGMAFTSTRIFFSRFVFNIMESGAKDGSQSGNLTNQQESGAASVATDGTNVYWVTYGTGNVRTTAIASAFSPTTLATGQNAAFGIAIDATRIYWTIATADGAVMSMPRAGGVPVAVASAQPFAFDLAIQDGYLYWSNQGGATPGNGSIDRVPVGGGPVEPIATGLPSPGFIAVDATSVYWTDVTAGTVSKAPLAGGTVELLATGQAQPSGLDVDGTCAYFADYAGGVAGAGSIRRVALVPH